MKSHSALQRTHLSRCINKKSDIDVRHLMKSSFKIFKPSRRVCPNKNTKFPVTQHNPMLWLNSDEHTHSVNSIDGFVVNQNGEVSAILSRYEYEGIYFDRNDVTTDLINHFSEGIKNEIRLAQLLAVPYRIFVWPKDYPTNKSNFAREIIAFFPKLVDRQIDLSEAKLINLKGLEAGIKKYRGRSFKSVKSLSSANSNLECHLANQTNNPWPGDIDAIITEKKSGLVKSIIEFKTHNIDSPIEDEFIGKYGKQDWRRFEVLYNLQSQIENAQGLRPKIFFVVWGTQQIDNHARVKVDEIANGEVLSTQLIDKPQFGVFSEALMGIVSA